MHKRKSILIKGLLILMLFPIVATVPSSVSAADDDWSGDSNIYNNNPGFVGIGTDAPQAKLHSNAQSGETALRVSTVTEGDSLLTFDGGRLQSFRKFGNGNLQLVDLHNGHEILNVYRNTDKVEIANGDLAVPNGSLGIGTSSPLAKSHIIAGSGKDALRLQTLVEGDDLLVFDGGRLQGFQKFSSGNLKLVDLYNGHDILRIYRNSDDIDVASGDLRIPKGRVGIGTTNTPAVLTVNGDILAEEIEVVANVADYVFADDYQLPSLEEVSEFITRNKHLPGVTPATSKNAEKVNLGDRFTEMLEKIEELYLYTIKQDQKIQDLENELYYLNSNNN